MGDLQEPEKKINNTSEKTMHSGTEDRSSSECNSK